MKWLKWHKPMDPGAEYIARLNAEAKKRETQTEPFVRPKFQLDNPRPEFYCPTVYFQPTRPERSPLEIGDMWMSDGATKRWNGFEWELVQANPSISAFSVTGDTIIASQIGGSR